MKVEWNASEATIAAFDAASWPSTSAVGQLPRSLALSLSQCIREGRAGGVHLVKNVVGGAVHNAQNAGTRSPARSRAGAQNRDSARNSSLVGKLSTGLISGRLRLHTVLSQQCLVTGDHGLTSLQSTQNTSAGRLNTTGQLNDYISRINQRFSVGGVQRGSAFQWRDALVSRTAIPINSHGGRANALFKDGVILDQDASSLGTDITGTKQCYFDLFSHDSLFLGLFRVHPGISSGYGVDAAQSTHSTTTLSRGGGQLSSLKVRLLLL